MPWLVVYQCFDTGEQEACFQEEDPLKACNFIATMTKPPVGFEDREGSYFLEYVEDSKISLDNGR